MRQNPGHILETRKKQQAIINFCIMTSHIYNIMCAATVVIRGYRFLIAIWASVIIYFLGKSFICIKKKKIGNHSLMVKNQNAWYIFLCLFMKTNQALTCNMVFLCPLKVVPRFWAQWTLLFSFSQHYFVLYTVRKSS